jgi:hypothetical protein
MEARFRALTNPADDLRADWDYIVGSGKLGGWRLAGGLSKSARTRFEALARMAGAAIENPAISDPVVSWLDLLRQESSSFRLEFEFTETLEDGTNGPHHLTGTVWHVCEASADHCSVLESRAFAAERADIGVCRQASNKEMTGDAEPRTEAVPTQPATPPKSNDKGRKRGPRPDYETAGRVAEVIARLAPGGCWRSNLDDVLMALDDAKIPTPKRWLEKHEYRNWYAAVTADKAGRGRHLAIEAIKHHLKRAKERPPETIP